MLRRKWREKLNLGKPDRPHSDNVSEVLSFPGGDYLRFARRPFIETQAARTAELFFARLWGTKMRSDEERLQRNHHAIPDVFI